MNRYNEIAEQKITRIIDEVVRSKTKANYRPLQPKAEAIGVDKAANRPGFEELQGE